MITNKHKKQIPEILIEFKDCDRYGEKYVIKKNSCERNSHLNIIESILAHHFMEFGHVELNANVLIEEIERFRNILNNDGNK